ncbi:MAG TPA: hypothetical protein VFA10_23175 [Ktedonobacteraceae bacterium]|nr:hypothetical protein [Ktedonobacteraceae bacterium]
MKQSSSQLLAGYGAVHPKETPEDFARIREEFERGVAEEVVSETQGTSEQELYDDQHSNS